MRLLGSLVMMVMLLGAATTASAQEGDPQRDPQQDQPPTSVIEPSVDFEAALVPDHPLYQALPERETVRVYVQSIVPWRAHFLTELLSAVDSLF